MSKRMYALSNDMQNQALSTVDKVKKYLHLAGNEAYDSAYKLGKQVKAGYPQVASNITDIATARAAKLSRLASKGAHQLSDLASARAAQLKGTLSHFGEEAYSATQKLGNSTRKAGIFAFKIGALYALVHYYATRNKELSEMTQKVRSHIEAKPLQSAGIALGIGYMIAKILR